MKKAFTLLEILIALALSSMIFLLVSSLLVTMLTTNTKNSRKEVFEQTKNDISVSLSNDIRWAEKVSFTPNDPATININDNSVVYEVKNNALVKNSEPITPDNIKIVSFTVENRSNDANLGSYNINIEMEHAQLSTTKDRLKIVVSQRKIKQEVGK